MKKTVSVSSSTKQGKASSKLSKTSVGKTTTTGTKSKAKASNTKVQKTPVATKTAAAMKKSAPVKAPITVARMSIQQSVSDELHELTDEQLDCLKLKLTELRDEIKESLTGKTVHFNASSHNESIIKGDDAEVAEKQRQSNAALQEMDMLKNRLVMVERALKKIEAGTYGLCEETEEPIAFERLFAIPWARYGVKVQEMRERRLREYKGTRVGL